VLQLTFPQNFKNEVEVMGLIKKWQIEKSKTLNLENNIAEVKDYGITLDKTLLGSLLLKRMGYFSSVLNSSTASPPIYWQLDIADSNVTDNYAIESFTPSGATAVLDNDLSTYYQASTTSSEEEIFRATLKNTIYGARIEIKEGFWTSVSGKYVYLDTYVSNDGSTWTQIAHGMSANTTEYTGTVSKIVEIPFRYVKIVLKSASPPTEVYGKIYELIII